MATSFMLSVIYWVVSSKSVSDCVSVFPVHTKSDVSFLTVTVSSSWGTGLNQIRCSTVSVHDDLLFIWSGFGSRID